MHLSHRYRQALRCWPKLITLSFRCTFTARYNVITAGGNNAHLNNKKNTAPRFINFYRKITMKKRGFYSNKSKSRSNFLQPRTTVPLCVRNIKTSEGQIGDEISEKPIIHGGAMSLHGIQRQICTSIYIHVPVLKQTTLPLRYLFTLPFRYWPNDDVINRRMNWSLWVYCSHCIHLTRSVWDRAHHIFLSPIMRLL